MWDTDKDYRILIAQKALDLYNRTVNSGTLRGRWNKRMAIDTANSMSSDFQSLTYSYLDPADLAKSPEVKSLEDKYQLVIRYLGGDDWNHEFLRQTPKNEKHKAEESIAKIRFFLRTISGLKDRLNFGPINDPIIGIDIIVGEIMSVSKHDKNPNLMICNVNIGKQAIKVVTNDLTVKERDRVGIAMLPPATFTGIASEGMFLGHGEGILKEIKGELGEIPKGIPIESLNESRNLIENFLKN
ncbi:tRNA-binding protein [Methanobrevibacter filiformis]|uniref:Phenylalanine--tRNA ligase beta subunit n=1 Tax=Methanobrevibacter filiformis TaxID=55758 RepID=A0A166F489_9EURY|nr:tRNA-binding protein [Methanobrevibacter filiformis]KZX17296.1 phenylalanine--tRNA ligase beta subunit [Methanobrevibacter filiformis]